MSMDARTELQMLSFEAPKVRLLRCLSIEGNDGMQVYFNFIPLYIYTQCAFCVAYTFYAFSCLMCWLWKSCDWEEVDRIWPENTISN